MHSFECKPCCVVFTEIVTGGAGTGERIAQRRIPRASLKADSLPRAAPRACEAMALSPLRQELTPRRALQVSTVIRCGSRGDADRRPA